MSQKLWDWQISENLSPLKFLILQYICHVGYTLWCNISVDLLEEITCLTLKNMFINYCTLCWILIQYIYRTHVMVVLMLYLEWFYYKELPCVMGRLVHWMVWAKNIFCFISDRSDKDISIKCGHISSILSFKIRVIGLY